MKLFKFLKTGKEKHLEEPTPMAEIIIDPAELYKETSMLAEDMKALFSKYQIMQNNEKSLSFVELNTLRNIFMILAEDFERVYKVMEFDMEKINELDKYNQQTLKKRQELLEILDPIPNKEDVPLPEEHEKETDSKQKAKT